MRRRAERWAAFAKHVQTAPGTLAPEARRHVFRAARGEGTPDARLLEFAVQVAEQSYRITEATVGRPHAAGHSDDEIFEAIVVSSVAAADRRLAAAHRALGTG